MVVLSKGGNDPPGSLKAKYLVINWKYSISQSWAELARITKYIIPSYFIFPTNSVVNKAGHSAVIFPSLYFKPVLQALTPNVLCP